MESEKNIVSHGALFRCTQCFYQSNRKSNVSRHKRRIHGRVKRSIICPCEKIFHTKGEYYAHCEAKHPMHRICSKMSKEKYKISANMTLTSKHFSKRDQDVSSDESIIRESRKVPKRKFMERRCSMRLLKLKSVETHLQDLDSLPLADRLYLMQQSMQYFSSSDEETNQEIVEESNEVATSDSANGQNECENHEDPPQEEIIYETIINDEQNYTNCTVIVLHTDSIYYSNTVEINDSGFEVDFMDSPGTSTNTSPSKESNGYHMFSNEENHDGFDGLGNNETSTLPLKKRILRDCQPVQNNMVAEDLEHRNPLDDITNSEFAYVVDNYSNIEVSKTRKRRVNENSENVPPQNVQFTEKYEKNGKAIDMHVLHYLSEIDFDMLRVHA